jgi:ABC-2 type transport system permease protein
MPNFQSILNAYSVSVVNGVVQENDGNNYYQSQYYLLPTVESTDITSDLNGYVLMLEAVGMTYEESDSYAISPLLTTSDSAVSLQVTTDEESGSKKASTDVAAEGPFNLGLEVASDGENYNFYIFGSYTMFNDNVDQVVSDTNMQVFKNIVSTFNTDEDAQTVVVDSKSYSTDYLVFTAGAIIWYGVVWGFILPVLLILIGIIVFARRRICK